MNIVLTFGKYKGKTVEEIAEADPWYIVWLKDNVEVASPLISQELYNDCRMEVDEMERESWGGDWEPMFDQD